MSKKNIALLMTNPFSSQLKELATKDANSTVHTNKQWGKGIVVK